MLFNFASNLKLQASQRKEKEKSKELEKDMSLQQMQRLHYLFNEEMSMMRICKKEKQIPPKQGKYVSIERTKGT